MNHLTVEEVNEMFVNVPMLFSGYYKYVFSFVGSLGRHTIHTSFGGNADDVYGYDVSKDTPKQFGSVYNWSSVEIDQDGEVVFEYSEWG